MCDENWDRNYLIDGRDSSTADSISADCYIAYCTEPSSTRDPWGETYHEWHLRLRKENRLYKRLTRQPRALSPQDRPYYTQVRPRARLGKHPDLSESARMRRTTSAF